MSPLSGDFVEERRGMGLDNYAVYPPYHINWKEEEDLLPNELFPTDICLCGGMFSTGTGNSFRGKVYDSWVDFATGYSLYDTIQPEDVKKVADILEQKTEELFPEYCLKYLNTYDISIDEARSLAKWFRTVANENAQVIGWY